MYKLYPFWLPPGFRPMSVDAIAALCNGDAKPDIKDLRAETLIIRINDHQDEALRD